MSSCSKLNWHFSKVNSMKFLKKMFKKVICINVKYSAGGMPNPLVGGRSAHSVPRLRKSRIKSELF